MQTLEANRSATSTAVDTKPRVNTLKPQQMGLIGFTADIGKVFQSTNIVNKDGAVIGSQVSMRKMKDIAEGTGLTGKENKQLLEALVLKQTDAALAQVLSDLVQNAADLTLKTSRGRVDKNGIRHINIAVKEVKRNQGPTDEQIAKSLGWTVEQVVEARVRQTAALAEKNVDLAPAE